MVHQSYEPRVTDEDVLRGNTAIVKCTIPSFVADYVYVVEWVIGEESLSAFSLNDSERNYGNRERPPARPQLLLSAPQNVLHHSFNCSLTFHKYFSRKSVLRVAGLRYICD